MKTINYRFRIIAVVLCMFLGMTHDVFGHSDPAGDIHPLVSVTQDVFKVTAVENYYPWDPDVVGHLVLTLDRKGHVLSSTRTKSPKPEFKPYREYSYMDSLPEEQNGLERLFEDKILIIPDYCRKFDGFPYFIEAKDGCFTTRELVWNSPYVGGLFDAVVSARKLYFFVSRSSEDHEVEFWIHRFSIDTLTEEACARFPVHAASGGWGMPICSNMIVRDGHCYVAAVADAFGGYKTRTW